METGKPDKNWTIYDIAHEAGVSANTVSKVLNDRKGVGKATRARIIAIMERVDYHPHIGARGLRAGRNACIGVTIPAPFEVLPVSQGFLLWLFSELFRVFGRHGEYICFDLNPFAEGLHADYARGIFEQLYRACIIAGPLPKNDLNVVRIHQSGVPYLALGRLDTLPECSSATVDYEQGAYLSTAFFLERGHKRIAMLMGFPDFQPGVERRRGYTRALKAAGIAVDEELIAPMKFGSRSLATMVHRLLLDTSVTALIDCSAAEDGASLREGCLRAGRVPGKDIEILAWTYDEHSVILREASAHLWLPVRESAAEGIERLADWIRGEKPGPFQVLYPPVLHEGSQGKEIERPKRLFEPLE